MTEANLVDNQDPAVKDNPDPAEEPTKAPVVEAPAADQFSWKKGLNPDLKNSPTLQKFDDTQEGLGKAIESHLSLEKMLGQDKVPIPKNAEDTEGWSRFSKAMGIPDKAEDYGLQDIKLPDAVQEVAFSKQKFADIVHSFKLTPNQANGLWKAYNELSMEQYNKYVQENEKTMQTTVNQLRSEWGDAYETNVDLGQTVINKFAESKEDNDYMTSLMTKDPRSIKFLSRIGNQFAENKIGEFSYKRFSLTPEQAQAEIDSIVRDKNHPYSNPKATQEEHDRALAYVNGLYSAISKAQGQSTQAPSLLLQVMCWIS